jgi:hypothetical protein
VEELLVGLTGMYSGGGAGAVAVAAAAAGGPRRPFEPGPGRVWTGDRVLVPMHANWFDLSEVCVLYYVIYIYVLSLTGLVPMHANWSDLSYVCVCVRACVCVCVRVRVCIIYTYHVF